MLLSVVCVFFPDQIWEQKRSKRKDFFLLEMRFVWQRMTWFSTLQSNFSRRATRTTGKIPARRACKMQIHEKLKSGMLFLQFETAAVYQNFHLCLWIHQGECFHTTFVTKHSGICRHCTALIYETLETCPLQSLHNNSQSVRRGKSKRAANPDCLCNVGQVIVI